MVEQKEAGTAAADAQKVSDNGSFSNTACTNGKAKRLVELMPGDKVAKKACEVHYKKETEVPGHDQVLWTSANDPAFCDTKAKEFVVKLSGMGWSCAKL